MDRYVYVLIEKCKVNSALDTGALNTPESCEHLISVHNVIRDKHFTLQYHFTISKYTRGEGLRGPTLSLS